MAFNQGFIKKYKGIGVAACENLEKVDRCGGEHKYMYIYIERERERESRNRVLNVSLSLSLSFSIHVVMYT